MNITDEELVKLIVNKNQAAFGELLERYGGLVNSIVKYHLKDMSMWQDDCVNDILFSVWQNMDKFDSNKNTLKNWIGAVSKYRCINYKRRFYKQLTECEPDENMAGGAETDAELLKNEIDSEIMSLLDALKPVDREIFIRHYIYEVPLNEISEELKRETAWIYNRISRGRKKMRKLYALKGKKCYEK